MVKDDGKDVGLALDFITGIQHAIHSEHHLLRTFVNTKDKVFLELAKYIREIRSEIMYKVIPEKKGENYCSTKHLSAFAQSLEELGNRFLEEGDIETSKLCFKYMSDVEASIILINQKGGKN